MKPAQWKRAADIRATMQYKKKKVSKFGVVFTKNRRGKIPIGGNYYGTIYLGRIHFGDGGSHRVAIKVFRHPLTDQRAEQYARVIQDFRNAGVRIPKMGMVQLPSGKWVQVSQLFGSTGKLSKIRNKSYGQLETLAQKKEAVGELVKITAARYMPASDIIEPFMHRPWVIPLDLDMVVHHGKKLLEVCAAKLDDTSTIISNYNSSHLSELRQFAYTVSPPKLRKILGKWWYA